jgi:hypothetical protein
LEEKYEILLLAHASGSCGVQAAPAPPSADHRRYRHRHPHHSSSSAAAGGRSTNSHNNSNTACDERRRDCDSAASAAQRHIQRLKNYGKAVSNPAGGGSLHYTSRPLRLIRFERRLEFFFVKTGKLEKGHPKAAATQATTMHLSIFLFL